MADRKKVINDLNTAKLILCNPKMLTSEMCVRIGQAINGTIDLLKEQEPLAVDEGKLNKCVCGNEINRYWHPEYCGFCGKKLEWN